MYKIVSAEQTNKPGMSNARAPLNLRLVPDFRFHHRKRNPARWSQRCDLYRSYESNDIRGMPRSLHTNGKLHRILDQRSGVLPQGIHNRQGRANVIFVRNTLIVANIR